MDSTHYNLDKVHHKCKRMEHNFSIFEEYLRIISALESFQRSFLKDLKYDSVTVTLSHIYFSLIFFSAVLVSF